MQLSSFENITEDNIVFQTKFSTIFRVKGKQEVKPLDYKDKYFNTRMAIIFDSIYLGGKIVYQFK